MRRKNQKESYHGVKINGLQTMMMTMKTTLNQTKKKSKRREKFKVSAIQHIELLSRQKTITDTYHTKEIGILWSSRITVPLSYSKLP